MVKEIKEKEFSSVTGDKGKVLVDCFATWCGPCQMMHPIIEEVAGEVSTCKFYKLDVDECDNVPQEYGIMSIPTLLLFEDGKLVNTFVGFKTKEELLDILK